MPMRLIDPKAECEIEVSGSKFYVRQLNAIQKTKLMQAYRSVGLEGNMPKEVAGDKIIEALPIMKPVLSEALIRMDGESLKGGEILDRIAEPMDYMLLAMEILNLSSLNEDESKN